MPGITHYFMNHTIVWNGEDLVALGIIAVILLGLSVWMLVTEIRDWWKERRKK
jgi:hypothetical protein